jgi:hypothetical protein
MRWTELRRELRMKKFTEAYAGNAHALFLASGKIADPFPALVLTL